MYKHFLTCFLLCILCSSSFSQNNETNIKGDTVRYKAKLLPLKVVKPTLVTKTVKHEDASYLNLFISKDNILVKFRNHLTHLDDVKSIEKFLIANKAKIDKTKVNVIQEKDGSVEKFKDVVSALSKNGITKFSLVSR